MEYAIREMIARKGRALEETDYARSNQDMLDFRLISGDFYEWDGGKLRFKDAGVVMDFAQVAEAFPPFGHIQYKSREKFPYLTDNLDALLTERKRGKTVAVEGGPCLFGEHEVLVSVQLKNGLTRLFDYANGKAYPPGTENPSAELFAADTRKDACAADMSYRKYLLSVLEFVREELRAQTLRKFEAVSDCITNFFIQAIGAFNISFASTDETVVSILVMFYSEVAVLTGDTLTNRVTKLLGDRGMYAAYATNIAALMVFACMRNMLGITLALALMGSAAAYGKTLQQTCFFKRKQVQRYGEARAIGLYNFSGNIGESLGPIVFARLMAQRPLLGAVSQFCAVIAALGGGHMLLNGKERNER